MRVKTLPAKTYRDFMTNSNFPSFHKSGSIRGMKEQFYGKDALLVRCGSYIYNVDQKTYDLAY